LDSSYSSCLDTLCATVRDALHGTAVHNNLASLEFLYSGDDIYHTLTDDRANITTKLTPDTLRGIYALALSPSPQETHPVYALCGIHPDYGPVKVTVICERYGLWHRAKDIHLKRRTAEEFAQLAPPPILERLAKAGQDFFVDNPLAASAFTELARLRPDPSS
jgi:hypothetical protein